MRKLLCFSAVQHGVGRARSSTTALTLAFVLQGLSIFAIGEDLVLYGGDKSGLAVCNMAAADWKWAAPTITG